MPEIFPFTPPLVENSEVFFQGFRNTLILFASSLVGAIAIGVVMATARTWGPAVVRDIGGIYVEFFRNTPLLIQLIFFQTLLSPAYLGITREPILAAIIGLSIYTGAFMTEVIRAGILSVDARQIEAARSLGLSQVQSIRHVVMPQAVRSVVPPLGNLSIALNKNTAIAGAIAVTELLRAAQRIETRTLSFDPFIAALFAYWTMTLTLAFIVGRLEKRLVFAR